ncbi:MAG: acyl carrier protein [Candidatus Dependentiae bacterium]|nr:acyl carrier protein [Candidatus Dependentiae bacterium]
MNREELREKLKSIIASQLSIKPEEIADGITFDELGADSLDRVEVVMKIEEAFDIELNDDEMEKITTFGALVEYVDKVLQAQA